MAFALILAAPFVGSFLAVLVDRLPEGRPVVMARSHCASCHRQLTVVELVPLVSYVALGGRCRTCRAPIGWLAPGMEAAALLIAIWSIAITPAPLFLASAALGWALLTLAVIDARETILPDVLTLPLILAGLLLAFALSAAEPLDHALGAVLGGASFWAVAAAYRLIRAREGLGLGDAKLFAAAGAWLGWAALPSVLLIASAAGLIAALSARLIRGETLQATQEIPFGPFLAAGFWLTWAYGPVSFG